MVLSSASDPHGGLAVVRAGASASRANFGLVLVHGRGGTAQDILGLGAALALPDLACVAPQAAGQSWWPTSFLAPMDDLTPWLQSGLASVENAVAGLQAEGLARDRIAIAGFSQGACLALEYAARSGAPLKAAFGFSGALVGTSDGVGQPSPELYGFAPKALSYETSLSGIPVYIGCHERDPHIPLRRVKDSSRVFQSLGAEVTTDIFPGAGHGITEQEIAALRRVLNTGRDPS